MRAAKAQRITTETSVSIELTLDCSDKSSSIELPIPFFKHMLEQLAHHGKFAITLHAIGDTDIDDHHLIEDIGITLGMAFKDALGDRRGIVRYGSARTPMDETLIEVDVDLCTRPYLHYDLLPGREFVGKFDTSLPLEFWRAFVNNCGLNLHIAQVRGNNAHHIIEASFKSVGRALHNALQIHSASVINSTKGAM